MARRRGWSRTFRRDSKLQQYFLDQVVPTGKTLGTGSYGSVLEVSSNLAARRKLRIARSLCNVCNGTKLSIEVLIIVV